MRRQTCHGDADACLGSTEEHGGLNQDPPEEMIFVFAGFGRPDRKQIGLVQ